MYKIAQYKIFDPTNAVTYILCKPSELAYLPDNRYGRVKAGNGLNKTDTVIVRGTCGEYIIAGQPAKTLWERLTHECG